MDNSNCTIKPWQQAVSSCTGGLITSLFATPFDVIKTRLQVQQIPIQKGQCFLYCNGLWDHICFSVENGLTSNGRPWYKRPSHFSGTWDALMKITKYEGLTSLWSGLSPTLLMAIPATMVYFTTYDQIKYKLGYLDTNMCETNAEKTMYYSSIPILAGALARVGAVTVISPLELIRTKVQSVQINYPAVLQALKQDLKLNGVLSLWKGWAPTILRDVPFSALYWVNYEHIKSRFITKSTPRKSQIMIAFISGGVAGTVASILTTPFDVIKTHRQIELGELEAKHINCSKSNTTFSLIKKLYRVNGFKGLYAGVVPRVIKVAPACAIMISTYEYGKLFFKSYNQKHTTLSHIDIT
ncbi:unnamed protein product [Gordionus sp. m RMFG-2023]|uniref:probable mitochondrial glutathione transporter SLC25A40 isoform X2 n=1 Tax=Gordionus sp. m RMFG-2023 TaxID=3053472 RepID=UPI0030DE2679